MSLSEADTRAKLIDPALHARGWTEDLIKREESAGSITIIDGQPHKDKKGRTDYTLRVRVNATAQPVAVALLEAKAERLPPDYGLEQAKLYARCGLLNVPFVLASNGHLFVLFDRFSGHTDDPRPTELLPTPEELRRRYEEGMGFRLTDPAARPLLVPYQGGEATRRYYQDAAIRAVLERIARGEKRMLLSLATGTGKTFIAVHLLQRISDAGQLHKALFLCDRDELRRQAAGALKNAFGDDAQEVTASNPQKNARVLIATYQTLNVDTEDADASFFLTNYPPGYFSHIIIDECHRSAWNKWSTILRNNPDAVQVGLTATPRRLSTGTFAGSGSSAEDNALTADNLKYFGDPVYEYPIQQAMDDGYLAACEVVRRDIRFEGKGGTEQETGLDRSDLEGKVTVVDATTGQVAGPGDTIGEHYNAPSFEEKLVLPDRIAAMCGDLFDNLLATGGPEQKSIVFCASDLHADRVATAMNNLYADWCREQGTTPAECYAFKCTAAASGNDSLPDLRGARRHHFIATTVDLLTTGVDVPCVRNIVFFKYVASPISFYQMLGRGTRLDAETGKLMFRVYDYTNATRLLGMEFVTSRQTKPGTPLTPPEHERVYAAVGFEVHVTEAGTYILANVDGEMKAMTVEEYRELLAQRLTREVPTLDDFRRTWLDPEKRRALMEALPDEGKSALLVRQLADMQSYDLYDVLAELGYGAAPQTRNDRARSFETQGSQWLENLPAGTRQVVLAIAQQFRNGGTEDLENPSIFKTQAVQRAGGIAALKQAGDPAMLLRQTKERLFTL